jgi:hypothetical protein
MAELLKVLGQVAPSAASDTALYTVPTVTSAVVSTLTICNRDPVSAVFRVAVRPAGAGLANQHYVYYDTPLGGNATFAATLGLTLNATDVVTVRASTTYLSFSLFGTEIT